MQFRARSALISAIALIVITAGLIGMRSESAASHDAQAPDSQLSGLDREDADVYCRLHQADGCWPQAGDAAVRTGRSDR